MSGFAIQEYEKLAESGTGYYAFHSAIISNIVCVWFHPSFSLCDIHRTTFHMPTSYHGTFHCMIFLL